MRPATKEERESVDHYIKSIAHKTGIVYMTGDVDYKEDFEIDDIDFFREHPKADMSKVDRIKINGKVYLAADKVLEIIDAKREEFYDGSFRDNSITFIQAWKRSNEAIRSAVMELKGGEHK